MSCGVGWGRPGLNEKEFQVFGCECHEFWETVGARETDAGAIFREVLEAMKEGGVEVDSQRPATRSGVGVQHTGGGWEEENAQEEELSVMS